MHGSRPAGPARPAVYPAARPSLLCLEPVSPAWYVNRLVLTAPTQWVRLPAAPRGVWTLQNPARGPGSPEGSNLLHSPLAHLSVCPSFWPLLSPSVSFVLEVAEGAWPVLSAGMWKFTPKAVSQRSPNPAPAELCSWQKEGKGCSYCSLHAVVPANSTSCPCLATSSQGAHTDPIFPPLLANNLFHLRAARGNLRLCTGLTSGRPLAVFSARQRELWRPLVTSRQPPYSSQPGRLGPQHPPFQRWRS